MRHSIGAHLEKVRVDLQWIESMDQQRVTVHHLDVSRGDQHGCPASVSRIGASHRQPADNANLLRVLRSSLL